MLPHNLSKSTRQSSVDDISYYSALYSALNELNHSKSNIQFLLDNLSIILQQVYKREYFGIL